METLQQHLIIIIIALSFLASFPLFPAYTTPDHYFLNCGSSSNATVYSRTFVGDEVTTDSSGFKLLSSNTDTDTVVVDAAAANKLDARYQTARVFSSISCYRFNTPQPGTYIIRLHFYSPSSSTQLSSARFNVSASGHFLITNFNSTAEDAVSKPVIKEFLLKISSTHFRIYFYPAVSSSSSSSSSNYQNKAFVNAIEVFLTPLDLTRNFNSTLFTSGGGVQQSNNKGFSFGSPDDNILTPVYRITVGGQQPLLPSDDQNTLWRNWSTDDYFLLDATHTTNITISGNINFYVDDDNDVQNGFPLATKYDAPDPVYRNARRLNVPLKKEYQDKPVTTWRFKVRRNSVYFLRAHFCDILQLGNGEVEFIFYINDQFAEIIDPNLNGSGGMSFPFYYDFLVESHPSGFLNVSIGPWSGARDPTGIAFLNGLEIMEVINSSSTSVKEPFIREPPPPSKNYTSLIVIVIAASVGGGGLVLVVITAAVCRGRRRRYLRSKRPKPTTFEAFDWPLEELNGIIIGGGGGEISFDGSKQESTHRSGGGSSGSPFNLHLKLRIPFSEIKNVTNNFDDLLVIGQGGFGKVYKGTLRNGKKVAVKRSDPDSRHGQGFAEFQAEITVLCRIRHRHLVSLIGYCNDHREMILVYEFMEKGTLKDHLYRSRVSSSATNKGMPWKQRLEICIGAAEGLHYLHMGASSTRGIIHRDVKATNILLDENYVAKVSDFGLSRLYDLDMQNDMVSTDVKGTPGYVDPEYYNYFVLTEKSDVYSFGIVLLEVLCARPVIDRSLPEDEVNLADWAMKCKEKGELEKIVDPLLVEKINSNSMKKFMEIIHNCLRDCGADRPPMKDVLWDLKYALQLDSLGGGSGGLYGDTTTTMDGNSLNMPMLAITYNESTSFLSPPNEEDEEHEDQEEERPWLKT